MPITAQCPGCKQALQVPDQFAGAQGKCPTCGAIVTFPTAAGAAPAVQAAPPPPAPPAAAYTPPPAAYAPPPAAYAPPPAAPGAYPQAPMPGQMPPAPAGPPMSTDQLVQMICVPAGLFFLFLMIVAGFLPWISGPVFGISGVGTRSAGIFVTFCVLVGAVTGLTYLFKTWLPFAAAAGAGLGVFGFLLVLGAILDFSGHPNTGLGAGVWIALIADLGIAGAFITLTLYRPLQSPTLQSLNLPFMKQNGGLVVAVGLAVVLGVLYVILTVVTR